MQCALLVDSRALSVMGATLANGGINPTTGERVLSPAAVEKVISVMSTCGMYDYSGNWAFEVGIPAKSGVGGGIVGVLPGQLSVAVFSNLS
jgi:glutaminase